MSIPFPFRLFFVSSAGKSEARRERQEMEVERDAAIAKLQRVQTFASTLKELLAVGDLSDDQQEALDNLCAGAEATP